jgi:hypothetical protein
MVFPVFFAVDSQASVGIDCHKKTNTRGRSKAQSAQRFSPKKFALKILLRDLCDLLFD